MAMEQDYAGLISRSEIFLLRLQRIIDHIFFTFTYVTNWFWLRFLRGYRIENLSEVRKRYDELIGKQQRSTVICLNHLTLIDSFIMIWAFVPWRRGVIDHSLLPWQLPERRNFFHKILIRICSYLGKCIPVIRGAPSDETRKTLNKLIYLLSKGDNLAIFPEGTRSRSGRIDTKDFTYGVGRILQKVPDANVLCVYLRGKGQDIYSNFPKKGDRFYIDLDLIKAKTEYKGLRGARDLSTQIVQHLSQMEHKYFESFATHRQ